MKHAHPDFRRRLLVVVLSLLMLCTLVTPTHFVRAEEVPADNDFDLALNSFQNLFEKMPLAAGQEVTLSVKLGEGLDLPEEARKVIEDLLLTYRSLYDARESDQGKLALALNLKRVSAGDEGVDLQLYNVGKDIVVSVPKLNDKAFLLNAEALTLLTGTEQNYGELMPNYLFKQRDLLLQLIADVRGLHDKALTHFGEAFASTQTFTVRDLSEDIQVMSREIPAEETPAMLTELLESMKALPSLNELVKGSVMASPAGMNPGSKGFAESIQEKLDDIQKNPDAYKVPMTLERLLDAEGHARGLRFTGKNPDGSNGMNLEWVRLSQKNEKALRLTMAPEDEKAVVLEARYTDNEGLATGDFQLTRAERPMVAGSFENLKAVQAENGTWGMEGKLSLKVISGGEEPMEEIFDEVKEEVSEAAEESESEEADETEEKVEASAEEGAANEAKTPPTPVETLITFEGSNDQGRQHYQIMVTPDARLESQYIQIMIDAKNLPDSELTFADTLPEGVVNLGDSENLNNLFSDSDLMNKLMNIVSYLGLDKLGF